MPKYFLLPLGLFFLVSTTLSSYRNSFRRIFRARSQRHRTLNRKAYRAAFEHRDFDQAELFSLRSCSQALFHKHDSRMKA